MKEKEALDFLERISKGISEMFGEKCETLIHDMSKKNHPIISINNKHISNRDIGSMEDIYGNVDDSEYVDLDNDFVNNLVITKSGKKVKSSTFHLKGNGYHYALGINYDFTHLQEFIKIQNNFINTTSELQDAIDSSENNRLSEIFNNCLKVIGKPIDQMKRTDRLRLITMLKEEKAFSFQKSVPYVSERLDLSRYTIYKYLKEIEE